VIPQQIEMFPEPPRRCYECGSLNCGILCQSFYWNEESRAALNGAYDCAKCLLRLRRL
jgi:hypothetical protein